MEAREDLSFGWQAAVFAAALVAIFSRLPGADVARFESLQPSEHMVFHVYDPGGRSMELIKR
jgi:hypothetical protein